MAKEKVYKPGKVGEPVPVTVTVTDGKVKAGDHVKLKQGVGAWGGVKVVDARVRSVKRQGTYEYAVVATIPYGNLLMLPLDQLTKVEAD